MQFFDSSIFPRELWVAGVRESAGMGCCGGWGLPPAQRGQIDHTPYTLGKGTWEVCAGQWLRAKRSLR